MSTTFELDPDVRSYLSSLPPVPPWWDTHDVLAQRIGYRIRARAYAPGPEMETEDREIIGTAGNRIPIRLYRPASLTATSPAVLYLHGGGWSVGDLEFADAHIRRIAAGTGALVLSADYRLAPDNPYPAGMDDCWTALTWLAAHAGDLGAGTDRLGISGDSAGATNCAALALMARNFGGPRIDAQCLWYPGFMIRPEVPSMADTWRQATLPPAAVRAYRQIYVGVIPDPLPATMMATQAEDLSDMPATVIAAAGIDPLCDESSVYADRLRAAGGQVELQVFETLPHGFCNMAGAIPVVLAAVEKSIASFAALLT